MADRPNFITRSVAAIGLSVRSKLLIAFLGITCLLVGLALFGLNSLRQANDRTEAMVRDQERFALLSETYDYVSDLQTLALAASIDPDNVDETTTVSRFASGGRVGNRVGYLIGFLGRNLRKVDGPDTPDGALIVGIRNDVKSLQPITDRIKKLNADGEYAVVENVVVKEFIPVTRRLQRELFTRKQEIEKELAARAEITARAYLTSRDNILAVSIAAVGVALLLGYSLSSALLWPIERIRQALGRISGGGFDTRVSVPNRDELGELAVHVNETSEKLGALYDEVEEQKATLAEWNTALESKVANQVVEIERTNRLRRFLPAQVAELITGAENETDALATRRGEITVLFADLRGFTTFANASAPDQVVGALNAFHEACGPLVEAEGGTLERFLGDGLMVLFGAPVPVTDAADRAVRLAFAMRDAVPAAMAPYQSDRASLGLGVGIGTGVATLGQIGFEGRRDYSAIGPAPNLAARLCDLAKDGQILLSHTTVWQITMEAKPAGSVDLKGIGDSITVFEV